MIYISTFTYNQNSIYYFYENNTKIPLYIYISSSGELIIAQDKIEIFSDLLKRFTIFGILKFQINLKITYDDDVLIHIIKNTNITQKTIDIKEILDNEHYYAYNSNVYYVNLISHNNFEYYKIQPEEKKKIIRTNKNFFLTFVCLSLNNNIIFQKIDNEYIMTHITIEHIKQLIFLLKIFNVTECELTHNQITYYNNKKDILKSVLSDNIPLKFQFVYQKCNS